MTRLFVAIALLSVGWAVVAGWVSYQWEMFVPLLAAGIAWLIGALAVLRILGVGWLSLFTSVALAALWYGLLTPIALEGVCSIEGNGEIACPGMNDVASGAQMVLFGIPLALAAPTVGLWLAGLWKELRT